MLAISRRTGETIVIDLPTAERVNVAVVRIRGKQVRLSVEAPRDVAVVREELLELSSASIDECFTEDQPSRR